ncbi:hypothetical protein [Streptomyces sp. 3213.3]|uniref:hypothetical protein n=1 Tax=Streptomyces sp. 3213.3 TaxID=1855348 RepID=UPI00135CC050|nr:hypothetical protein [Streptomyces sp. 3213.3]
MNDDGAAVLVRRPAWVTVTLLQVQRVRGPRRQVPSGPGCDVPLLLLRLHTLTTAPTTVLVTPTTAGRATRGAPQALQVADRWHLWHNLGEAAEKCVYRHRGCLRPTPPEPEKPQEEAETAALSPWPTGHRFAERTRAKHATIHALLAAGHSKRSVARQLGMTLNTILRFFRATTPEEMFTGQWQSRATRLDDYKPYLDQRWQEGCTNAWKLWEESRNRAIHADTAASATMSAGLFAASPNRSAPGRQRPARSRAGSSPTPMPYLKAIGSSSKPPWPTAPN